MLAIFGHIFVMADIASMHQTVVPTTWVPKTMTDNSALPRIAAFANTHDPALLYAELLRKYTSGQLPLPVSAELYQWYDDQVQHISGYFCKHDGLNLFIEGPQTLTQNPTQLAKVLASFKARYQQTDWTLPVSPVTEAQKVALQAVVDANRSAPDLLARLCRAAEVQPNNTKCPILYGGEFSAAPHVHPYQPTIGDQADLIVRRVFSPKQGGYFIDFEWGGPKDIFLYRPHAYLVYADGITTAIYRQRNSWIAWSNIQASVLYADGAKQDLNYNGLDGKYHCVCMHDNGDQVVASSENLVIGKFSELLTKGPFISHMTSPRDVKTLHILVDNLENIPHTTEGLLLYLSGLSLDQQKFIIKQLFPFLTV